MDSKLYPLFHASFRQAESADARMGIRREDPKDDRRKKQEKEKDDQPAPVWEDVTDVSLSALRAFLQSLLPEATVQPPANVIMPAVPEGHDAAARTAAGAYAHTARIGEVIATPAAPAPAASTLNLSQDEIRKIHQIMDMLDRLQARGVGTLTIQRNGTFLDSISAAADMAEQP